ncbi:unnamed protein product [Paramecium sonneborni]|uniref:Uncharacterized protein n=1 Tax=Paramecium sonneborni TaxID=65129 RepID=A0A8S1LW20_9CILI|nr:unnamed protein product [Paramecium sonneborni]
MITAEILSDKPEDQYSRLEKAMIELFKYDNLLNNEYLVRKFETDMLKPDYYLLQYVVVQRENSIKSQYVQNELNTRKKYHLILTDILNKYNKQLWNFDHQMLIIRPYFPTERKRIQIKIPGPQAAIIKVALQKSGFVKEELVYEEEIYQADKSYVKLILKSQTEGYAVEIFDFLMSKKVELQIDSVIMQNVDYLDEFHKQINSKKCQMMTKKIEQQDFDQQEYKRNDQHEEQEKDHHYQKSRPRGGNRGRGNYGYYRNEKEDDRHEEKYQNKDKGDRQDRQDRQDRGDRNERGGRTHDRRGGQRDRGNNQYVQKNEVHHQQQQVQSQQQQKQSNYQLIPKTVLQKTPKQNIKPNSLNANDFPALDSEQKS